MKEAQDPKRKTVNPLLNETSDIIKHSPFLTKELGPDLRSTTSFLQSLEPITVHDYIDGTLTPNSLGFLAQAKAIVVNKWKKFHLILPRRLHEKSSATPTQIDEVDGAPSRSKSIATTHNQANIVLDGHSEQKIKKLLEVNLSKKLGECNSNLLLAQEIRETFNSIFALKLNERHQQYQDYLNPLKNYLNAERYLSFSPDNPPHLNPDILKCRLEFFSGIGIKELTSFYEKKRVYYHTKAEKLASRAEDYISYKAFLKSPRSTIGSFLLASIAITLFTLTATIALGTVLLFTFIAIATVMAFAALIILATIPFYYSELSFYRKRANFYNDVIDKLLEAKTSCKKFITSLSHSNLMCDIAILESRKNERIDQLEQEIAQEVQRVFTPIFALRLNKELKGVIDGTKRDLTEKGYLSSAQITPCSSLRKSTEYRHSLLKLRELGHCLKLFAKLEVPKLIQFYEGKLKSIEAKKGGAKSYISYKSFLKSPKLTATSALLLFAATTLFIPVFAATLKNELLFSLIITATIMVFAALVILTTIPFYHSKLPFYNTKAKYCTKAIEQLNLLSKFCTEDIDQFIPRFNEILANIGSEINQTIKTYSSPSTPLTTRSNFRLKEPPGILLTSTLYSNNSSALTEELMEI